MTIATQNPAPYQATQPLSARRPVSALRPEGVAEDWQERVLDDGSRHSVYKRWFTAEGLARELGGGEVVHAGPWFVAVRSSSPRF